MRRSVKMIPTEETEEQAELFSTMMQTIVNEWDPYINSLKKKSLPLHPNELQEVQKAKNEMSRELDDIFCLDKSSSIAALIPKLGRKLLYNYNFFRYYERDHGIQHARAEQYTTAIILAELEAIEKSHPEEDNEDSEDEADVLNAPSPAIADTEATNVNVKHHEEDKNDEFLNADVQAQRPRRKRKKKHQGMCPLKPTPRPAKLNKSLMKKILLRRKTILIPNRVRNLLDPAPWPQCHLFPARKQVKPTIQPEPLYSSQPVPAGASSLLQVSHRSSSDSYRQSRVRQANVNSRSSNGTDEAVSVPNILYVEDPKYNDSFHAVTDFYSAQDYAVRSWLHHSPIT